MALYEVVFNKHEKFSSDVNVGTSPTPTTTVLAALCQADVALVKAESPEDAETAVRVVYNGITTDVTVAEVPTDEVSTPEPLSEFKSPDSGTTTDGKNVVEETKTTPFA